MNRITKTVAVLSAIALAGCTVELGAGVRGTGDVEREERRVSGFSGVAVENQGDLFIEMGSEEKLVIEAEANLLPYIETEVRNGTLRIDTRRSPGGLRNTRPIRYYLTAVRLDSLRVSSAGNIEAPRLEADDFRIQVTSAGDVKVDALYADRLEVDISSAGDVTIRDGEVGDQEVTVTSAGDYKAAHLVSRTADVRLTSAGDARIRVEERLDARLSSSGDLVVYGNPRVQAKTSSSGDIIYRD